MFDKVEQRVKQPIHNSTSQQPIFNNENIGKIASTGTVQPIELTKKFGERKKSFLSNTGKALTQQTSVEGFNDPLPKNVEPASKLFTLQVYTDNVDSDCDDEALEFTKPTFKYYDFSDDYYAEAFELMRNFNKTSSPIFQRQSVDIELDCSYDSEYFKDINNDESIPVENHDLYLSTFDFDSNETV